MGVIGESFVNLMSGQQLIRRRIKKYRGADKAHPVHPKCHTPN